MKTAVIVDSVRTGLAKSHRGGFNITRADDMLAHIINAMLDRNPNLPPEMVEDVIMGCGNPEGAMGHNIGRNAAPESHKGPDPEASRIQDQATGWNSDYKTGKGVEEQ